jgi:hypothetical protein
MNSADRPSGQSASVDPVRAYLLQLELALETCDPALRHDALIDAEEHLRASVAAGTSPAQAIAEYGSPEEIAAAYRSIPTSGGSLRSSISTAMATLICSCQTGQRSRIQRQVRARDSFETTEQCASSM